MMKRKLMALTAILFLGGFMAACAVTPSGKKCLWPEELAIDGKCYETADPSGPDGGDIDGDGIGD